MHASGPGRQEIRSRRHDQRGRGAFGRPADPLTHDEVGDLARAGVGLQFLAHRLDQGVRACAVGRHGIRPQRAADAGHFGDVGVLIRAAHARLAIADPGVEETGDLGHMDPGEQARVADAVGGSVGEGAAELVVDAPDPVDCGLADMGVIVSGDGDELGSAAQAPVHVGAEVGVVPDAGEDGGMQHLQQQAGDPADHHGDDVAVDAPGDRVRREQGVSATQRRSFAPLIVVEQFVDAAADPGLDELCG